jgi:(2S)-methylsuccinyl-CoA dehydrogenase
MGPHVVTNDTMPDPDHLVDLCERGLALADHLLAHSRRGAALLVLREGRIDPGLLDAHQLAAHGFAWQATYVEALRRTLIWARALRDAGALTAVEAAMLRLGFAEYLAQLGGGIPVSQTEMIRPGDVGVQADALWMFLRDPVLAELGDPAALATARQEIVAAAALGNFGNVGIADETIAAIREQFLRYAQAEIAPHAQGWHQRDQLIPIEVVRQLGEMGVFGLTVSEEHGGSGLGKIAMCVVSEALSGGYIGVGSLGTRSEIAAELVNLAGTDAQKAQWLPGIASGAVLPTAVFTEPGTGSDLGSLRTRAVRDGDVYRVTGAKTWITHGSRSDLMTLLVRTDPNAAGYRGLSMLLAPKPRGTEADPFPAPGMSGTEINVLGYRGMKEYEIGFEDFRVPVDGLLGGVEGQGFKQLMETFESARIQTGARALGVAQNALELGMGYATERNQFGRAIVEFPRVSGKLAWMATETMMARQLTYFAARQKDSGQRCDIEAGMAKLLAARVAWANADSALQVHGGNGYAVEYPISRVLCDARILSIFEGAAEIQAQVIARGLIGRQN